MDRKRFIYPSLQVLKEWVFDTFSTDRTDQNVAGETSTTRFDNSDFRRRDPEHLPPRNLHEKVGSVLRQFYYFIGSEDSSLGLWAACATMTIAILAFLKNTHIFFINQRVVWASVSIAVSMSPTSGFSVFGLFGRVAGSVLASKSHLFQDLLRHSYVLGSGLDAMSSSSCSSCTVLDLH